MRGLDRDRSSPLGKFHGVKNATMELLVRRGWRIDIIPV